MSSDASFDGYSHSPTAKSVHQLPTQNYYFDSAPSMGQVETEAHRQQMIPRIPVQPTYAPAYAAPYMSTPSMGSYYPAMQPTPPPQPQVSGLYFQRPLPQVSMNSSSLCELHMTHYTIGLPTHAYGRHAFSRAQPMATPPLHLAPVSGFIPSVSRPLHLPDLQQSVLPPQLITNPQPLAHG